MLLGTVKIIIEFYFDLPKTMKKYCAVVGKLSFELSREKGREITEKELVGRILAEKSEGEN